MSATFGFIGDARAAVTNLVSRIFGSETRYSGDNFTGIKELPKGTDTSLTGDVIDLTFGVVTARYGVSGGGGIND